MVTQRQALITGGNGDLAQALASELTDAGMTVQAPGRDELDVCDEGCIEQYFAKQSELELVVCNAGITDDTVLMKMSELNWDSVLETNLKGAFLSAKSAAKQMVKRRVGHIVFISSYSAFHPPVGQANYGASKAALTGLALSLAQELGGRNIRVNVIIPGFMETKMTYAVTDTARESALEKHALGSFNTPIAVAKFLRTLHLSMPHTSGQIFNLDSRVL